MKNRPYILNQLYLFLCLFCFGSSLSVAELNSSAVVEEKHKVFFEEYCVSCHNEKKQKGKVRLDDLSFSIDSVQKADFWQKILDTVNSGDMPPEDEDQPPAEAKTQFLDHLGNTMVKAREILSDSGGEIVMRRLNRREYQNTMRELLGVHVNVSDLPSDKGTGSFDTVGASLFMSSDQTEEYFRVARKALDEYFIKAKAKQAKDKTNHLESYILKERREVEESANKKIAATHNNYFKPLYEKATAFLENDRSRAGTVVDEKQAESLLRRHREHLLTYEPYIKDPLTQKGVYLCTEQLIKEEFITLPPDKVYGSDRNKNSIKHIIPGKYMLRVRVGANPEVSKTRHFLSLGSRKVETESQDSFTFINNFQITSSITSPQIIEYPVEITTDGPRTFVLREKRDFKNHFDVYQASIRETGAAPLPALWIDWVEWEGPLETNPSDVSSFVSLTNDKKLTDTAHAREAFKALALRAFRGKNPSQEFLDKLSVIYDKRRSAGESHDVVLKDTLSIILSSPGFLYLQEIGNPAEADVLGKKTALSATELASRLSYFLWSAPPDEQLYKLAFSGELKKPKVLASEVERMIASPKNDEFVKGFVHQWLGLDRLDFFQFNTLKYPEFDQSMKMIARQEVYYTFEHLLKNQGSLKKLLKSDEIYINGLLGMLYGIPDIDGDEFRPVKLPKNSPRGGLLGMSAILAMGSDGEHTSPVERGAWVLRKLLNDPPPPAPPNVPQLTRLEGKLLTTKERLAAHMEEPQCASCHRKIDPVGFGLENFDAIGKWRTKDSYSVKGVGKKEWPIIPKGAFHNGPSFDNYFQLRDLIANRSDDFAQGFVESLIEYALGRPYGFTDDALAKSILTQAKSKNYAIKEFIHALVESDKFMSK